MEIKGLQQKSKKLTEMKNIIPEMNASLNGVEKNLIHCVVKRHRLDTREVDADGENNIKL